VGLVGSLLTLPVAPVRMSVWAAEQVLQQAEEEFYDPGKIRRQIEDVDRRRASGELTDDEATELEDELVDRLIAGRTRSVSRKG
jgi:hypothetical protein